MTPLGIWLSKFIPPKAWLILKALKNLLNAGSQATGAYSKTGAPTFPQPLLSGLKGNLLKGQVESVLERALDKPEPPHIESGMSHLQAAILSAGAAILSAAIQGLDFSLIFTNPKQFGSALFTALVVAWAAYLKEPNRSKVDVGSNKLISQIIQADTLKNSID